VRLRVAAMALLALALPGCFVPEEPAGPRLIGACPQWQDGPSLPNQSVELEATPGAPDKEASPQPANLTLNGRPLNRYRVVVDRIEVTGGVLELRAFVTEGRTQRNWFDYRAPGQHFASVAVLNFRPGDDVVGQEFDTLLTPVTQSDPGQGAPIELEWTLNATASETARARVGFTVVPGYRVCGASADVLP
jgi:hypothetical protein